MQSAHLEVQRACNQLTWRCSVPSDSCAFAEPGHALAVAAVIESESVQSSFLAAISGSQWSQWQSVAISSSY